MLFALISFMLMHRPPARSTLFPYTTLFRSVRERSRVPRGRRRGRSMVREGSKGRQPECGQRSLPELREPRSEEHTSELQSRRDLVCRLLLEKKKVNIPSIQIGLNQRLTRNT